MTLLHRMDYAATFLLGADESNGKYASLRARFVKGSTRTRVGARLLELLRFKFVVVNLSGVCGPDRAPAPVGDPKLKPGENDMAWV